MIVKLQEPPEYEQFPCWDVVGEVRPKTGGMASELFATIHHAPQPVAEELVQLLRVRMELHPSVNLTSIGAVALLWGKCHCHIRPLVKAPDGSIQHALIDDAIKNPDGEMRGFAFRKEDDEPAEPVEEAGVPAWARGLKDEVPN